MKAKTEQEDIYGNKLSEMDSFSLTYSGPSFENQMELNKLYSQLQATEKLIHGKVTGVDRPLHSSNQIDKDATELLEEIKNE